MSEISIFHGVVRSEDSYTNLLRNLVETDKTYAKAVFRFLLPLALERFADESFELRTQVSLNSGTNGRADVLIESPSVVLLVEVKTSPYCTLTPKQELIENEKGYLTYLLSRKTLANEIGITFLAPSSWNLAKTVSKKLGQVPRKISTKFVVWENLVVETKNSPISVFAHEFNKLLARSFPVISFDEHEKELFGLQGPAFSSASRKLDELVRQSRRQIVMLLESREKFGFRAEWFEDASESGYLLYLEKNQVFWIGVWNISPFPLVVAVKDDWKLSTLSTEALNSEGLKLQTSNGWRLYSRTELLLCSTPLDSVLSLLVKVAVSVSECFDPRQ